MSSKESITLSREGLYKEIWDHSAAAVARKYNIAYGELTARCKAASIPLLLLIAPSGRLLLAFLTAC